MTTPGLFTLAEDLTRMELQVKVDEADVASGKIPVIAPNLFMEYAVSENIIAGPAIDLGLT